MKRIFEKSNIGNIELKNRVIRAATWEGKADEKGHITDNLRQVYEDLAKGGASAIITGYAFVLEQEQPNPKMMGIYDDSFIDEYRELTDMVHSHDSKIIMQIVYGGPFTFYNTGEREIWAPSSVEHRVSKVIPKEMTLTDINTLVRAFTDAALRAKKSGFDGVEIHAGHGYLLNLFLAPYYNQRTDAYGGSSENRARIIHEVYEGIRFAVGDDFPVLIKLNCSDFMNERGQTFEETLAICRKLAENGIDAIEISGGSVFKAPKIEKEAKQVTLKRKESYFSEYAKEISEAVDVPVILVGGNRSLEVMDSILNETEIECFSLCRPLLSEPDLVNKWMKNPEYKPMCTSCGKCFDSSGNSCIFDREGK